MRILLIDDSPDYTALLQTLIHQVDPEAQVRIYNPDEEGRPGPDFLWQDYDILFLDYMLGKYNGLDWLREFKSDPDFPTTIFLTGQGDETVAVNALKLGAEDYIRKIDLNINLLRSALDTAIESKQDAVENNIEIDFPVYDKTPSNIKQSPLADTHIAQQNVDPNSFELIEKLGEGGTASVFLAKDLVKDELVAIKFLDIALVKNEQAVRRFTHEYHVTNKLSHPNLAKVKKLVVESNVAYIVMEYFPDGDLKSRIKNGTLDLKHSIYYIQSIASALDTLHTAGIIHRDIKPTNIMFGEGDIPVLTDFGLAKDLSIDHSLTIGNQIMGTPYYICPEQIKGQRLNERSDIYSLGIMFYEVITGNPPFSAHSLSGLMYKHIHDPMPLLTGVPDKLNDIISMMTAKEPDDRYPDAKILQLQLSLLDRQ